MSRPAPVVCVLCGAPARSVGWQATCLELVVQNIGTHRMVFAAPGQHARESEGVPELAGGTALLRACDRAGDEAAKPRKNACKARRSRQRASRWR